MHGIPSKIDLTPTSTFNRKMTTRCLPLIITTACMALASGLEAKSKLGEYFLGFSYFAGDASTSDSDVLDFEIGNPISASTDYRLGLSWINVDAQGTGDDTSWWLDIDMVYHYDDYMNGGGMFRPYVSGGIGYMNDSANVILGKNGLNWKLAVGSEFLFTDSFSASVGLNFYGMWSHFAQNDSEWEFSLLNWFGEVHGVGLEYRHANDMDIDYIGLRYLYSWQ